MKHLVIAGAAGALSFLTSSCATGPVVPVPPTLEAVQLNSTLITPDVIKFVGKVAVHNRMNGPLQIQKVDYAADLHDSPLFDSSFDRLDVIGSGGTQTVTLPFQVAMQDVVNQVEDVLADEAVRVTLRGTIFPDGFEPIPFTVTKVIPAPRLPQVSLDGVRGSPLDGEFTVFLRVENTNGFPMSFQSVKSHLQLNNKRYQLLQTESFAEVGPGQSGRVALTMRQTRGKGLSMLVNVARNQGATDFAVGGSITCNTPHGLFHLPLEVASSPAAQPAK